ncbi:MAG: hypothetical protein LBT48_03230 [Prevotellaceae bacterium]|jgi:hypothetical protein|nr:hypothetical protein [Prevotellaceae bacterium]
MAQNPFKTGRLSYFFDNHVLIRTLYFPGVRSDSLNRQPVARNYFLVSVYDEDTNRDSLITTKDLRKFYHIDRLNTQKTQLIPSGYSAIRSDYDFQNDVMYIYARYDVNDNGTPEKNEPVAIYWIKLSDPTVIGKII